MNVGILGSGDVAKALASGFLKHGHNAMLGTRDASKLATWAEQHPNAQVGSFSDSAKYGELVVLAVKGSVAIDALRLANEDNLAGKTVIDTTNPITDQPPVNGVLRYYTSLKDSQMEQLQREFPSVHFVKAFNSVGNALMVNPEFSAGKPSMFICGNDAEAKQTVSSIVEQFGWEVEDMGNMEAARAIEPLCILWCIPGFLHNDWAHAFKVLR
ncbi:MAG: NAD(P)-binding domain-containing protein [Gammaproteobacteria bacterium]|jgi:predicted dinucleotide-binding enzyme|nr:NAD(P)-binding domain-containing protein [Gammaproteobacteria bacterium]